MSRHVTPKWHGAHRRGWLCLLLLMLPGLAPVLVVMTAAAIGEFGSGTVALWTTWFLIGIGALGAGLFATLVACDYISRGSKLLFVIIFCLEFPLAFIAWSYAYDHVVTSWR